MDGVGRVIVVANRQPYTHTFTADDRIAITRSTSGLVTASEPLVRRTHGVWVGHGSGSADRMCTDRWDGVMVPTGDPQYRLRRVWMTPEEERLYYDGFANEALWPLCHRAHVRPIFRSCDFDAYWAINERFTDAVCDEARGERATVLIQDYHFALAPLMISSRLPLSTVVAFWHIPWPTFAEFEICPWGRYLVEGLLGSHLVGFQTATDCAQFLDAAEQLVGARTDRLEGTASYAGHEVRVRSYPASVEWPSPWASEVGSINQCAADVRRRYALPPDARLAVGVDRLDYTKGLVEKMLAVEDLLDRYPEFVNSFVLVQVAQPSRQRLPEYRALRARLRDTVARINGRFAAGGWQPIVLVEDPHEPADVYRLLRAAEICYVGSLHDGMNLVSKEFVSARDDERGVLVLSGFTGAARELTDASIINPYDVEQAANTLADALRTTPAVQQARMRRLRSTVARWDAGAWSAALLKDAAALAAPVDNDEMARLPA